MNKFSKRDGGRWLQASHLHFQLGCKRIAYRLWTAHRLFRYIFSYLVARSMAVNIILGVFFSMSAFSSFAASLKQMQLENVSPDTQIVCSLSHAVTPKFFTLANPHRVVVDFPKTTLQFNLKQLKPGGLIKQLRSGQPQPGTLRLVFDVKEPVVVRLHPQHSPTGGAQIQINLAPAHSTTLAETQEAIPQVTRKKAIHVKHSPPATMRDVIVVLDPGHGGKDPGARGPGKHVEKNVTLSIALKLKQLIDKQPGMRAVLTRNGDYYVGLRKRLDIARQYNADVFISIHADAFVNSHSNGASVFALSPTGATSEAARWLAEKENYSELGGVNLADLDDQSGVIRTVLIDLSQTATIGASLQMGSRVLHHLDTMTTLHNHKVEQARFVVLKSPDIPSILIETGFITNPVEEANLTNPFYQQKLTQAIYAGLKNYFWEYPPQGSRIEALSNANRRLLSHKISTVNQWG